MHPDSIERITIRGFKSIAGIEDLELRPINILIGANGSGKSNFIELFELLRAAFDDRLDYYVKLTGNVDRLVHFGPKSTMQIYVKLCYGNQTISEFSIAPNRAGSLLAQFYTEHPAPIPDSWRTWRVYHFHDTSSSSPMRKTAKLDDNTFLRPDGSNLAAFLYFLGQKNQDSYRLIRDTIRQVAPFFDDFDLKPLNLSPSDIKLEWRHKDSDAYFDASYLSDGTLRFVALATLFLQPEKCLPSLVLLDEPELGLHPYAIELLAAMIRRASVDTQVIVSTQSSRLVDYFEPEDILVADLVDRGTQIRRLDSSQLDSWLKEYSLGELWEKNEFGGRPVPA